MPKTLTFCDPVHGLITFHGAEVALVKHVIQHPQFQRLRHIKQLGLSDLLFPCATHTRFSHSLGVCFIAKRIYEKLSGERTGELSHAKEILMQAALLHDIGHGPFSHTFETFVKRVNKQIKHDDHWLSAFLQTLNIHQDVKAIIARQNPDLAYLSDIVSSQLDADRMDYLLRDSHFCGVSYGEFETEWLINSLELKNITEDGTTTQRICVNIKGISALEHFIMARRLMMRYVYAHPFTLSAHHLLVEFLSALATALTQQNGCHADCLQALQQVRHTYLGEILYGLKTSALDGKEFAVQYFEHYQHLTDDDIYHTIRCFSLLKTDDDVCMLAQRLFDRQMPHYIRLDEAQYAKAQTIIADYKDQHPKFKPWQITVHSQNFNAYCKNTRDKIFIINHAQIVDVQQKSMVLDLFGDKGENSSYLLIDGAIVSKVKSLLSVLEKDSCIHEGG